MRRVLEYLDERDPEMAKIVRADYSCFGEIEPQTYGLLAQRDLIQGCHMAAVDALAHVSAKRPQYAKEASIDAAEDDDRDPRATEFNLRQVPYKLEEIHARDDAFITELVSTPLSSSARKGITERCLIPPETVGTCGTLIFTTPSNECRPILVKLAVAKVFSALGLTIHTSVMLAHPISSSFGTETSTLGNSSERQHLTRKA
jgi:hypothetical protein